MANGDQDMGVWDLERHTHSSETPAVLNSAH